MKIPPYALDKILPAVFLLLAAALAAACGGGKAPREPVTPKGEAANAAPAAAATPTENVPKIVAFGDSLTAGYGLSPQESYPSLLQKMLDADAYSQCT